MNRTCSVDGCDRQCRVRGWCQTHYTRWLRNGDVHTVHVNRPQPKKPCKFEGCKKPRQARGLCKTHWLRWRKHGDPNVVAVNPSMLRGAQNAKWRGDGVGYNTMHHRLRLYRGRATGYICMHCGSLAQQWAYDHADPDERIGDAGRGRRFRYSTDLNHYIPLCRRCHRRFDLANLGRGTHG